MTSSRLRESPHCRLPRAPLWARRHVAQHEQTPPAQLAQSQQSQSSHGPGPRKAEARPRLAPRRGGAPCPPCPPCLDRCARDGGQARGGLTSPIHKACFEARGGSGKRRGGASKACSSLKRLAARGPRWATPAQGPEARPERKVRRAGRGGRKGRVAEAGRAQRDPRHGWCGATPRRRAGGVPPEGHYGRWPAQPRCCPLSTTIKAQIESGQVGVSTTSSFLPFVVDVTHQVGLMCERCSTLPCDQRGVAWEKKKKKLKSMHAEWEIETWNAACKHGYVFAAWP